MRVVTLIVLLGLLLGGCGAPSAPPATPSPALPEGVVTVGVETDLDSVRSYMLDHMQTLKKVTGALRANGEAYYARVGATPDYAKLWQADRATLTALVQESQNRWLTLPPLYEQIESIVAGVPVLARYNLIIRVGASAESGGTNTAPFDLALPDGRVLVQPGNLFALIESALWGADPRYAAPGVQADFDGDGTQEPGETLPDAALLKGALDALDDYTGQLLYQAQSWQPTLNEAFTVLSVMLPTVDSDFTTWRDLHAGGAAPTLPSQMVSRLVDVQARLATLRVVYTGVSAQVRAVDPAQDRQLDSGLRSLHEFVTDIHRQEQAGRVYTVDEAILLEVEAQDRTAALGGQVTQVMALLGAQVLSGTAVCGGLAAAPEATPAP